MSLGRACPCIENDVKIEGKCSVWGVPQICFRRSGAPAARKPSRNAARGGFRVPAPPRGRTGTPWCEDERLARTAPPSRELPACCFRSTEGRLNNVKNKSGLFSGFHFSNCSPSMYLGACTRCMLCTSHETVALV